MTGLRAILVSVDYDDLLSVTLPYNRHHFDEIMVVTTPNKPDKEVALRHGAKVYETDAFYRDGAVFNKWRALEEGLDEFGREGWLCIMDADVLWPRDLNARVAYSDFHMGDWPNHIQYKCGQLISPLRRMVPIPRMGAEGQPPLALDIENCWRNITHFPIHRNVNEWAGYSQIFHADDPVLGPPPWHQTDWVHAGGADSFFQQKWPKERKVRPPFECLHLGEAGVNWFGRASTRLDGQGDSESLKRRKMAMDIWTRRRTNRASGLDQFTGEKLT